MFVCRIFHIATWDSDGLQMGYSKNHLWSYFVSGKYVNFSHATFWPKVGSCNLESELNYFAELGVVL